MQRFVVFLCFIIFSGISHADETQVLLVAADELIVEGPLDIQLAYGMQSLATFDDAKVKFKRVGNQVSFHSTAPAIIVLEVPCLQKLSVQEGSLRVKVEGNERLTLEQISAPSISVQLFERARLDSQLVEAQRFQVSLSDQGRASLNHVDADVFEIKMADHGDLNVAGLTRIQQVELSGYAHYDADMLESQEATVALDDFSAGLIQTKQKPMIFAAPFTSISAR